VSAGGAAAPGASTSHQDAHHATASTSTSCPPHAPSHRPRFLQSLTRAAAFLHRSPPAPASPAASCQAWHNQQATAAGCKANDSSTSCQASYQGACAQGTCAQGTCAQGICAQGTCAQGTCAQGTCAQSTCAQSTSSQGASACAQGTCAQGACAQGTCRQGTCHQGPSSQSASTCAQGACAQGTCRQGASTCAQAGSAQHACHLPGSQLQVTRSCSCSPGDSQEPTRSCPQGTHSTHLSSQARDSARAKHPSTSDQPTGSSPIPHHSSCTQALGGGSSSITADCAASSASDGGAAPFPHSASSAAHGPRGGGGGPRAFPACGAGPAALNAVGHRRHHHPDRAGPSVLHCEQEGGSGCMCLCQRNARHLLHMHRPAIQQQQHTLPHLPTCMMSLTAHALPWCLTGRLPRMAAHDCQLCGALCPPRLPSHLC